MTSAVVVPAIDRQRERALGDEHVARHRLERRAGGIGGALVVAGDDPDAVRAFDADLRRAEDVPGGVEADAGAAERQRPAVRLRLDRHVGAEAAGEQRRRRVRAQVGGAAGAGVIAVRVGDQRPRHRAPRVDVEVAGLAVEALGRLGQHRRALRAGRCCRVSTTLATSNPCPLAPVEQPAVEAGVHAGRARQHPQIRAVRRAYHGMIVVRAERDDLVVAPDRRQEAQERRREAHLEHRRRLAVDAAGDPGRDGDVTRGRAAPVGDGDPSVGPQLVGGDDLAGALVPGSGSAAGRSRTTCPA